MFRRHSSVIVLLSLALIATATPGVAERPATVFAHGAELPNSNGLFFDAEGRLLVASGLGRQIAALDPGSGRVLERLGPADGVEAPDDLAFAPDGTLYWTAFVLGSVGRRTPDGEIRTQFVAPGLAPITVSDDGRVFTSQCYLGSTLYEVDPELLAPPRVVISTVGPGCGLNGMDFGPDGYLYGPRLFLGDVLRVDPDSGAFTVAADGFGAPTSVKFDSQGRLHAVDSLNGEVVRVDLATGSKEILAVLEPGHDSLAFDGDDRLFVSNTTDAGIFEVLPAGAARPVSRAGLAVPGGLAVMTGPGGDESVFVADVLALWQLDARSGRRKSVTRNVLGFTPMNAPFTVAAGDDGKLLLSGWFDNTVQIWDPAAGVADATFTDFAVPLAAITFEGDLVVSELATGQVVRADGDDPSQRVVLADGLAVPAGLAAAGGDLWVAVWGTGELLQLVEAGTSLAPPRLVASGLATPEGLAVDIDGTLLVVESTLGRLSRVDPLSGARETVADDLELGAEGIPGFPPTWIFNGVAVGSHGIYVSGERANVIYRLHPTRN